MALRLITRPGKFIQLATLQSPRFEIGIFLLARLASLADVDFTPQPRLASVVNSPPRPHSPAMWIGRCCEWFRVGKRWILMLLQKEQGLCTYRGSLDTYLSVRKVKTKRGGLAANERWMKTKGGWLAVVGQQRWIAATGYGIPDPGANTSFPVERYLGFDAQIFYACKWINNRRDEFARLRAKGKYPRVKLYTGEVVLCGDEFTYFNLRYTPNERILGKVERVAQSLFDVA